jgi:hypothetical protein
MHSWLTINLTIPHPWSNARRPPQRESSNHLEIWTDADQRMITSFIVYHLGGQAATGFWVSCPRWRLTSPDGDESFGDYVTLTPAGQNTKDEPISLAGGRIATRCKTMDHVRIGQLRVGSLIEAQNH